MNKKGKRLLIGVFVTVFLFMFKVSYVNAACSISVSAPRSATVGNTFNVTSTVSSDVGSWLYVLSYDPSKVQLVSGSTKVVGVIGDSKTNSYTFKALSSGTTTFRAVNASLASNSTNKECSASTGSASISMKTLAEIEASYSRNNNLSALSVEGATLSPEFNADVTEYTATLPIDTTKAKIIATAADGTASIAGAGEIDVVDGINKIEIVVTAQHGEKKTYTINLTVEELDPIKVKVNGEEYTIVRKSGQVENIPVGFVETKIKVQNQEVVAYESEATKLILLALKNEDADVRLFIYDKKTEKFQKFTEAKSSELNLMILDNSEDAPYGFVKTTFKYNKEKIDGYKVKSGDENHYLVYAQNLETGNKGFYLYDVKESSFQSYFTKVDELRQNDIKIEEYIIIGLLGLFILIILTKIFKSFGSKEKKIKKYQKKINKLKKQINDEYVYVKGDNEPDVKKVEEDEYIIPKKTRKEKIEERKKAKELLDKEKTLIKRVSLDEDD